MRSKLCLTIALVFVAVSIQAGPRQSNEVLIRKAFSQADSVHVKKLLIPDTIRSTSEKSGHGTLRDTIITVYTAFAQSKPIGYGLAASVQSKSSVITVLVCLDTLGSIVRLELPHTPDPISSRLQSARWKKQFAGKSAKTLGRIDAVSGATISSHDITRTVKALMLIFQKVNAESGSGSY